MDQVRHNTQTILFLVRRKLEFIEDDFLIGFHLVFTGRKNLVVELFVHCDIVYTWISIGRRMSAAIRVDSFI